MSNESHSGPDISGVLRSVQSILNAIVEHTGKAVGHLYQISTTVTSIPEKIGESARYLGDRVNQLMQSQIDIEILKRVAAAKSAKERLAVEIEVLEQERTMLDENLESIKGTYDGIYTELNGQHVNYVRKLGAHIYDMFENDYFAKVEKRLKPFMGPAAVQTMVAEFDEHASEILRFRDEEAEAVCKMLLARIDQCREERNRFRRIVAETSQKDSVETTRLSQFPVWLVECQTPDGKSHRKAFFPGEIEAVRADARHAQMKPLVDIELDEPAIERLFGKVDWRDMKENERKGILGSVAKGESRGWLSADRRTAPLKAAIEQKIRDAAVQVPCVEVNHE